MNKVPYSYPFFRKGRKFTFPTTKRLNTFCYLRYTLCAYNPSQSQIRKELLPIFIAITEVRAVITDGTGFLLIYPDCNNLVDIAI